MPLDAAGPLWGHEETPACVPGGALCSHSPNFAFQLVLTCTLGDLEMYPSYSLVCDVTQNQRKSVAAACSARNGSFASSHGWVCCSDGTSLCCCVLHGSVRRPARCPATLACPLSTHWFLLSLASWFL